MKKVVTFILVLCILAAVGYGGYVIYDRYVNSSVEDLTVTYGDQTVESGASGYVLGKDGLTFGVNRTGLFVRILLNQEVSLKVGESVYKIPAGYQMTAAFDYELADGKLVIKSASLAEIFAKPIGAIAGIDAIEFSEKGDLFTLQLVDGEGKIFAFSFDVSDIADPEDPPGSDITPPGTDPEDPPSSDNNGDDSIITGVILDQEMIYV